MWARCGYGRRILCVFTPTIGVDCMYDVGMIYAYHTHKLAANLNQLKACADKSGYIVPTYDTP
jgi:hypothetical protein